jgi:putative RNA 2'-phosphotransferase
MDERTLVRTSKFLSLTLRHQPERIGLTLQPGGWVPVQALLDGCAKAGRPITRADLEAVVASNDKQRFAFDETGERIRANQGHSVPVDLEYEPSAPPAKLFHGTADRTLPGIERDGLQRMSRHHVHLSPDVETAVKVGTRHGRPVVLVVDAEAMARDGFTFFRSTNGVWLTEHVPPAYLKRL